MREKSVYHPFISAQQLVKSRALSLPHVHCFPPPDIAASPPPPPPLTQLRHHLEQLASLMAGIASELATMKRQIMSGRALKKRASEGVGGRWEELEY